jgi:multidrug efflux pump subunit AcrA (membrane-fusion protein)
MLMMLILAGLLAACGQTASPKAKIEPAKVEPTGEGDLKRLVLTEDAVRRLAIKTDQVRDAQVARKRVIGGEVMAVPEASTTLTASSAGTIAAPTSGSIPAIGTQLSSGQIILRLIPSGGTSKTPVDLKAPRAAVLTRMNVAAGQTVEAGQQLFEVADTSKVLVHVPVYMSDLDKVDRSQPASVLPLAQGDTASPGITANLVEQPSVGTTQTATQGLYYMVDSANHGLIPGRRVRVEFTLTGGGAQQKVIPYASVIYDLKGDTWAYMNPAPLTFVRGHIAVDYIEGDLAVLSDGPAAGTAVVTDGAAELYGTETGIGK